MNHERFWVLLSRKLAGEDNPSDKRELEELLENDAECRRRYEAMALYWDKKVRVPFVPAEVVFQKTMAKVKGQQQPGSGTHETKVVALHPQPKGAGRVGAWLMRVAAVLVLGVMGYFLVQQYKYTSPLASLFLEERSNAKGIQSKIILADGSTVWLNADSKLQFPANFTGNNREVFLAGEAFFEVAKDPRKPFIIHLKDAKIKVLGTSFNVRAFEGEPVVETSVLTGRVAFIPNSGLFSSAIADTLLLTPNNKVTYSSKTGAVKKSTTDSRVDKAWTEGKLLFRATPFAEIGMALERKYGKPISFENPDLAFCRLTASFENNSLEEVLYLLARTKGYTYTIHDREVIISGPGCPPR